MKTQTMGVLPGEMDYKLPWKSTEELYTAACRFHPFDPMDGDCYSGPDLEEMLKNPEQNKVNPRRRALSEVPPPPEKPKYGIVLFGLILAGAYLILGGKKN
jgi:hypothetical protein